MGDGVASLTKAVVCLLSSAHFGGPQKYFFIS